MTPLLSDNLEVPLPDVRGNRLTDRSEDTEVLHVVVDVLVASALQEPQRRRSDVELSDLVLLDHIPVAREVGVGGSALENDCRGTQEQGRIHDIGVSGDPTDVSTAEETVVFVNVKDVLAGSSGAHQVTAGGVHDTLGLSSRAGGVEQEQRVFRIHRLRGEVVGELLNLLVPPDVSTLGPRHISAGALVDQDGGDIGALLQGLVHDSLCANHLATAPSFVGGDDDLGLGVQDTVTERVGGEAGEDDGVDGTDTGARKEGDDGLRDHGQVDGNGVSLLDTLLLEDPRETGHLAEQLAIGDAAALVGLIRLVDDGNLVGVLDGMAVNAVERRVQTALDEPGVVAVGKRANVGGLEILLPGEELTGQPRPEGVGGPDRLLVELLVFLQAAQVRLGRVVLVEGLGDVVGVDFVSLGHLFFCPVSNRPMFGAQPALFQRRAPTGMSLPLRPWEA